MRLFIFVIFVVSTSAYERYEGYKVLQATPMNTRQAAALAAMESTLGFEIDFFQTSRKVGQPTTFMTAGNDLQAIQNYLRKHKISTKTIVADMSKLVDESMAEIRGNSKERGFKSDNSKKISLDQYNSHSQINKWLQTVASNYSSFVTVASLGKSLEKRDMLYLKIGKPAADNQKKIALWLDAGIHAREWMSPAAALYTINQLVKGYNDGTLKSLLDAIDVYVAPCINPDGYQYSRTEARMWRKTRSGPYKAYINGTFCYGVDMNRNWDSHWAEGSSSYPCYESYPGPFVSSEVETVNVKTFLDANNDTIVGFLTVHTFGNMLMYPWGYKRHVYPSDVKELKQLAEKATTAIKKVHGTRYSIGSPPDLLHYSAPGNSMDYAKKIGIKWTYAFELGSYAYKFTPPAKLIAPTGAELFAAFMVIANHIQFPDSN